MSSYLQDEESPFDEVFKEPPKKEEEKKEEKKEGENLLDIEHPEHTSPFSEERENVLPESEEKFQERTLETEKKSPEGEDILSQVGTDKFQERNLLGEEEKPVSEKAEEVKTPEKPETSVSEPEVEESSKSKKVEEELKASENPVSAPPLSSESSDSKPSSPPESEGKIPEREKYINLVVDLLKEGYYTPAIDAIKEMEKVVK